MTPKSFLNIGHSQGPIIMKFFLSTSGFQLTLIKTYNRGENSKEFVKLYNFRDS